MQRSHHGNNSGTASARRKTADGAGTPILKIDGPKLNIADAAKAAKLSEQTGIVAQVDRYRGTYAGRPFPSVPGIRCSPTSNDSYFLAYQEASGRITLHFEPVKNVESLDAWGERLRCQIEKFEVLYGGSIIEKKVRSELGHVEQPSLNEVFARCFGAKQRNGEPLVQFMDVRMPDGRTVDELVDSYGLVFWGC